ncbi:TPA: hypothetical protein N0F65_011733 [Lagenidium giganteum]|uniref:Uncharacterized protein n=1 Tax=Lagenidium giganteum TaxID=4803 RepID=A0AAV2YJD9_9STRA|nr:TPA: hypothetical protein N0F65_011733 [Lagenidium giganteum]
MRKERVVLTLVYLLLGTALALIARFTPLASSAASILLAVLWLGFLLAISFMETWVKFRAPFPPHHFGVDVGRTVYRALHAVERGLVLGLWLVHVVGSPHITTDTSFALLITLKLLVVVQHRMLFPKVELRAQHELYNALKVTPVEEMDHKARQELDSIQERVQTMPLPSTVYRVAYGIAEVSKMALLTVFAFEYLTRISDE